MNRFRRLIRRLVNPRGIPMHHPDDPRARALEQRLYAGRII